MPLLPDPGVLPSAEWSGAPGEAKKELHLRDFDIYFPRRWTAIFRNTGFSLLTSLRTVSTDYLIQAGRT
jgi:hypothetical protein